MNPPAVLQGVHAAHVGAAKPEVDHVPAAQAVAAMHAVTAPGLAVQPTAHEQ